MTVTTSAALIPAPTEERALSSGEPRLRDGQIIEGAFRVVGEAPKREPIIGSWWGFVALGLFIALNFALRAWWAFAYGWGMKHIHVQLCELLQYPCR